MLTGTSVPFIQRKDIVWVNVKDKISAHSSKLTPSLDTLLGTTQEPGRTPFCLQYILKSTWHRVKKVLEISLFGFGP